MAAHRTPQRVRSANLQAESYVEREHNPRWAALGVAHPTSGITANVLTLLLPRSISDSSTDRIPHSEFSLLTLIGTAFSQRNEMRTHLCLGSTEIAQWIVRAAAALSLTVYVHANSSILIFALTVTYRTNPVRVPGVIVRLCSLGWPTGLRGQVKPLASSETTVLKTRFGSGDVGDPLSRSIAFDRTSTERSCHVGMGAV